jgi:protein subunit release factor A
MEYNKRLYESLLAIEERYHELDEQAHNASLSASQLKEVNRQLKRNKPIIALFQTYKAAIKSATDDENALSSNKLDNELAELAKIELEQIREQIPG